MSKAGTQLNLLASNPLSSRSKIHKGWLYKQEGVFGKKFAKKYFVLYEGKILGIYDDDKSHDAKEQVDLIYMLGINESKIKPTGSKTYKHVFEIKMHDRLYVLSAIDTKAMSKWIDYLTSTVFGNTIHRGWLVKQGEKVKSWKKR